MPRRTTLRRRRIPRPRPPVLPTCKVARKNVAVKKVAYLHATKNYKNAVSIEAVTASASKSARAAYLVAAKAEKIAYRVKKSACRIRFNPACSIAKKVLNQAKKVTKRAKAAHVLAGKKYKIAIAARKASKLVLNKSKKDYSAAVRMRKRVCGR